MQAYADSDFKEKHDFALRNIGQFKNEIDALRADLREKNLELNDLESDENTLIGQLDQRAIEIEKLKNELNSLLADS
jgi:chromosome segregation ATPase